MPELPEVETTLRGLMPHLSGQVIKQVIIRNPNLRWPIPKNLPALVTGQTISKLERRAKYLLLKCDSGTLILHLGMSGSLRVLPSGTPAEKHDHFDLILASGKLMRLRDPRRFGAVLWHPEQTDNQRDIAQHPLLAKLGPEPLLDDFSAEYLHLATRKRSAAIKQVIMDSHVVVGVGNIYASESLFYAGIRPQLHASKLSLPRCARLVQTIRETLSTSIAQGGSTLRDFTDSNGKPGYFQQNYAVYGRTGEPCRVCGSPVKQIVQGQRSSFYCAVCQK
jgi:formamidopyrimidine-DNA glycosylase